MGAANETGTETSTDTSSLPTSAPGTEQIASELQDEGYEIAYQPGNATTHADPTEPVAFIEVDIPQDDVEVLEEIVKEANTPIPHRIIKPTDTAALPDWTSGNTSDTGNDKSSSPVLIVPSPYPSPPPEQKAEFRASSL